MDTIRLIFILSNKYSEEKEASEIMLQAFEACRQNVKTEVSWVKESNFKSLKLNKTDFVIFEDFEGKTFDDLKESKCARILGPWVISICLMEGKAIPNFPWPIYNVAMYGCIVTSSNLPKTTKLEIKEKVQVMGGCYVDTLVEKITHLVTDNPKSEKYLMAAEAGVALRCSSWIDAVWAASQSANVHANDKEFEKYICLPFQNLHISCTGLSGAKERKDVEKLITQHGGTYSAKLNLTETDVLVCSGMAGAISEKYKAARKRANIKCVDIDWLRDSIDKGYALPHHLYQVKKSTSTPTKVELHVNPDFSVLSAIGAPNTSTRVCVDDTVNVTSSPAQFRSPLKKLLPSKRKGNLKEDYCQLVDNLDIKKAKRAGNYLDGCSVYVTGFNPEHMEKLSKILNLSGATRYDHISERVTHVIVGDPKYHEVSLIASKGFRCLLVSLHWLMDSIEMEQPVNEEKYLLSTSDLDKSDFSSPLSKKGVNLLRSNKTITDIDGDGSRDKTVVTPVEDNVENDILQQYLKPTSTIQEDDTLAQLLKGAGNTNFTKEIDELPKGMPHFKPSETSTQQSSASVTQDASSQMRTEMFFEGLKFLVIGFEDTHFAYIKELIEGFAGELVPKSFKGIPDFIVVPVFNNLEVRHVATEIVNDLYINDCAKEGGLLREILYYHRPFDVPDATLLENCVITISGYSSYERSFLMRLIEALGGQHQEQFARVTSKARGVVASTHLVSDKPSGKKYLAALKWGLPVINKDWLLKCARTGQRIPETTCLMEDGREGSAENTPSRCPDTNKKSLAKTFTPKITSDIHNISVPTVSPIAVTSEVKTANLNGPEIKTPDTSNMQRTLSEQPGTNDILSNKNVSQIHTPIDSTVTNNSESASSSRVLTPINQVLPRHLSFNDSTDKPFTQATPVNKIVQQYRESNLDGTPGQDIPDKFLWMGIKTPDTPLGACIRANPSPQLRKECELWLKQFPDFIPPPPRRLSTPLSEIKRQLWAKILNKGNDNTQEPNIEPVENQIEDEEMGVEELPPDEVFSSPGENTQNQLINNRLQQLEDMVTASGGRRRQSRNFQSTIPIPEGNSNYKDSQACTVGWDFTEQEVARKMKIFILSGIGDSTRAMMVEQIEKLGAAVSDLHNYDPSGTHLLCPKPLRNEKTLSCMAAGKWCLHTSYLEKSVEAGHFLDEEEYEFGNPKAAGKFAVQCDKDTETRMRSMYWWRKEVARRGYGAFNDMRAIVVAQKRDPIVRVIEAGGGVVINVSPPFDDTVHATHCLLEQRSVRDYADYIPLAQQGVYLLNTIYISDFLHNPDQDIRECILPYFAKHYTRK